MPLALISHLLDQAAQQYNHFPTSSTEEPSTLNPLYDPKLDLTTEDPRCEGRGAFIPCWAFKTREENEGPDLTEAKEAVKVFAIITALVIAASLALAYMWLKYGPRLFECNEDCRHAQGNPSQEGTMQPPPSYDELMRRDAMDWAEMGMGHREEAMQAQVMITRIEYITEVTDEEEEPPSYAHAVAENQLQQ